MTSNRREFLLKGTLASAAVLAAPSIIAQSVLSAQKAPGPMVLSTWDHGIAANAAAWKVLVANGCALDAVEQGVMVPEADPLVTSVGYGGMPDRDGYMSLDACIMDEFGNAGSVAALQEIMHPISVARKVMEKTPHVMLVGEGAQDFALKQGFKKENLLTENARKAWEEWKKANQYTPVKFDRNNHDTIGMLAIDAKGNISGACTTSGMAWKLHGRVGDSPIIGAGLFVDNEVGGACATGKGEAVIRIAGSAIVVELMRAGLTPQQACEEAVKRIIRKQPDYKEFQVGFLAMNKRGETGAYSLEAGFQYALCIAGKNNLLDAPHHH